MNAGIVLKNAVLVLMSEFSGRLAQNFLYLSFLSFKKTTELDSKTRKFVIQLDTSSKFLI